MGRLAPKLDTMHGERSRRVCSLGTVFMGQIAFDDGSPAADCLVQNFSMAGAQLYSTAAVAPPSSFRLLIRDVNKPIQCHVVWQRGADIGVRFNLGSPDPKSEPGDSPSAAEGRLRAYG